MKNQNPVRDLIAEWPTRQAFADAVGANVEAVHKWAANGRIPADWQLAVQRAARTRGLGNITAEWMLNIHSRVQTPKQRVS